MVEAVIELKTYRKRRKCWSVLREISHYGVQETRKNKMVGCLSLFSSMVSIVSSTWQLARCYGRDCYQWFVCIARRFFYSLWLKDAAPPAQKESLFLETFAWPRCPFACKVVHQTPIPSSTLWLPGKLLPPPPPENFQWSELTRGLGRQTWRGACWSIRSWRPRRKGQVRWVATTSTSTSTSTKSPSWWAVGEVVRVGGALQVVGEVLVVGGRWSRVWGEGGGHQRGKRHWERLLEGRRRSFKENI